MRPAHTRDEDCTVDPATDGCVRCGATHGDPCPTCGGRGFHRAPCGTDCEGPCAGTCASTLHAESSPE